MRRLTTFAASSAGQRDRISVAVPATSGAAKLVPCTHQYPPGRAPSRSAAGAVRAVAGPVSEPDQSSSAVVRAGLWRDAARPATATTPGSRAGYQMSVRAAPAVALPVQATTTTSWADA